MQTPSYKQILAMAAPFILANCTTPLLGLADTAIIGNFSDAQHLGAIAVGALILSFIYWGFGFLRMSTTGFVAQAMGNQDQNTASVVLIRAMILGFVIGLILIVFQKPLIQLCLWLLGASAEVENLAHTYFSLRIWGAPATLTTYALMGYLIGSGQNRTLLALQLLLNGLNIGFDLLFAGFYQLGAAGVALGTLLAEWLTLLVTLYLIYRQLVSKPTASKNQISWQRILNLQEVIITLKENSNILIRTLFLLLGFALFTDQGARFGDTVLAANHLLLQLISFSAFFLDGYANVSEYHIGRAIGAKNRSYFRELTKRTTLLAALTALALALCIATVKQPIVNALTNIEAVRTQALEFMPYGLVYIVVSFAAFQLDGIFIGATESRALRNASIVATLSFILAMLVAIPAWKNHGLWIAFIIFVICRALALSYYFPKLENRVGAEPVT